MMRRPNWRKGFRERFAIYSNRTKQALTNRDTIWLHAVSVGEVNLCTQLIRELEPRIPNLKIVVSTTTSTGRGLLEKYLPTHIERIYYPIDRRKYVVRAHASVRPLALILIEAEIWPNFLWRAYERKIPVILVNARLSDRSFRGYRRFGFLFRDIFARMAAVGCQNEEDAARLRELGCRPEAVHVVGNLKFDAAKLPEKTLLDISVVLAKAGVPADAQILILGSTHAGEERILAGIYQRLQVRFPKLFLVAVPRHVERAREAGRDIESVGVKMAFRSDITATTQLKAGSISCLVVNTTGELRYFYEHASVVFVGKSLTAEGGQNPLEPGSMGKPIVFGPNMQNFEAIATALVKGGGALQVANEQELETALIRLLSDDDFRAETGRRALAVVDANKGAVIRTADLIMEQLEPVM